MNDLRTDLDQLEDSRLDYVLERSKVNSDSQGYKNAGIAKTTFYGWSAEERKKLNDIAQSMKRNRAIAVNMVLQDAAEQAAITKVEGLKSRNERIKQDVATEILDRVAGKPTQRQEITTSGELVIKWEDGED